MVYLLLLAILKLLQPTNFILLKESTKILNSSQERNVRRQRTKIAVYSECLILRRRVVSERADARTEQTTHRRYMSQALPVGCGDCHSRGVLKELDCRTLIEMRTWYIFHEHDTEPTYRIQQLFSKFFDERLQSSLGDNVRDRQGKSNNGELNELRDVCLQALYFD